jgi:AraC-like DNA-binding protein
MCSTDFGLYARDRRRLAPAPVRAYRGSVDEVELDWAARRPHLALRGLVSRYGGYHQRGFTMLLHRGLPSEHVTFIVSLADPVRMIGMPGTGQGAGSWQGFASGLHTGPALIAPDEVQAGIQLDLNPLGVRTLLGVSASDLAGCVVDLTDLPRPGFAALPGRLREAPTWARRFEILDEVLLASARRDREYAPAGEIGWAWHRMRAHAGSVRIADLAADVGWSRRHFSERFAREIGLAPKQAARVVRFGRATAVLRGGDVLRPGGGGLGGLAHACGYFDQAHLTNEFKAMAGCTPGSWIAEELPFLQYPGPGSEAE